MIDTESGVDLNCEVAIVACSSLNSVSEVWIPFNEVQIHPHSFADPGGRLFLWKGDFYRALGSQQAPFIESLFHSGIVQKLIVRGLLVETEITNYKVADYSLVVRHRAIPFPSYPNEWCAAMLKDATLAVLEIVLELAPHGLTLKDAHPWNFLYDGRPVWVDLNSIAPFEAAGGWQAYEEFRRFCLNPLLLMAHGDERLGRLLLCEEEGVSDALVKRLTRTGSLLTLVGAKAISLLNNERMRLLKKVFKPVVRKLLGNRSTGHTQSSLKVGESLKSRIEFLQRIKRQVEEIPATFPAQRLGQYFTPATPPPTASQAAVSCLLAELRPVTMLDVGGQAPWLAEIAQALGARVVSFNTDSTVVACHYFEGKARRLPLLPLIMDFTKPTPARGLCDHWAVAASERFGSEMVLALGSSLEDAFIKHHLNFEQIAAGLSSFTQKWVVAEFEGQIGSAS